MSSGEGMDRDRFVELIKLMFSHSEAGSGSLYERWFFTNDGVLAAVQEEVCKMGFGIASGLAPSSALLQNIDNLNRRMVFGHYWLAPGSDSSNWSLICGFKFQFEACSEEFVIDVGMAVVRHNAAVRAVALEELGDIPHAPFWLPDTPPDEQAFVLGGMLA